ncbi:hypothetical protein JCM6882_005462 [Rhodosporidiobolus microsporus]
MSDSKPPAELTTPAAPPVPSTGDSAPPPSPSPPAPVPPRTYSAGPLVLAAPPAYAPNSSVPKFLRVVAALILIGGGVGAAVGWIYTNIIFPRLVVALQARTKLFQTHEGLYGKMLESVQALVKSVGVGTLGGKEAVEFRMKEREEKEKKADEGEAEDVSAGGENAQEEQAAAPEKEPLLPAADSPAAADAEEPSASSPLPPQPQILGPLTSSLSSLSASLRTPTTPARSSHPSNPSNLVQPTGTLLRSLVTFNEYLESEAYAASTVHSYGGGGYGGYRGGGVGLGGAGASGERKALMQVVGDFKAEVRSVKGALLNRRNFAQTQTAVTA